LLVAVVATGSVLAFHGLLSVGRLVAFQALLFGLA
jgi:hypothetical protein